MNDNTAKILHTAIEVASAWTRRLYGNKNIRELIKEYAHDRELSDSDMLLMETFVNALIGFADAVRIAERKNTPLVPHVDETIPPRGY